MTTNTVSIQTWHDYVDERATADHTIVGTLKFLANVHSPQLDNQRDIYVYLPPSYERTERRYPVIYMHDGQNLFDAPLSYAGEWRVDETMQALSEEGYEAIIVGIPNAGLQRIDEYAPFVEPRLHRGGKGAAYVAFLTETVKPLIDQSFRTLPDRAHTGTIGSSMGGLISLWAFFHAPSVFGFAGAMSPSVWFARQTLMSFVHRVPFAPGAIYMDVGTHEGSDTRVEQQSPLTYTSRYLNTVRQMRDLLERKGYRQGHELRYIEEDQGVHNEESWARRLPDALRFLLGAIPSGDQSSQTT